MSPAVLLNRVRADSGRRAMRYSAVSVVSVAVTQIAILVFHGLLGWSATASNFGAVSVASVPAYLLNRAWVWGKRGDHHLTREVLPFWGMALIGLAFSTLLVAVVDDWSDSSLAVMGANIVAFGVLWVAKFLILDQLLFGTRAPA
jgi:putative flippase GtrA